MIKFEQLTATDRILAMVVVTAYTKSKIHPMTKLWRVRKITPDVWEVTMGQMVFEVQYALPAFPSQPDFIVAFSDSNLTQVWMKDVLREMAYYQEAL